ncbi:uncharacterized protein K460DRAFT_391482 [Cucurbitaria berberidis CBS 394.84]|uniref:TM7S3/TM198-like domain-containing protein n=1 Tax=Cucurbitaria berberidis CBS 394.84 TaxID=1168544 RepID=A0A9P4LDS9_9PLEO|nr:uncharacterized protein K460DRAFT_391482 [Cucurbitaria berberidis CBS 394.84]KAF1851138.1 hypothetical protein K460DRAFT_391482 [Cucurbitaria berberidis CBS 394.84]
MRSYRSLLLCLALILCLQSVAAVPQAVRRQDDSPSNNTPAPSATTNLSLSPSATATPSRESSRPKTESTRSSSIAEPSATASTVIQAPATTTSNEPVPTSSAGVSKNLLPIHPKLTPAMGLSGALLLLTGLVYAVIGIKNKWIYVFGSAAYLTALAVTVLIVYLMTPPVTDAIQGAFFVAAFFTGVIFGVLSLIFSDITEGFGCLLGGFCLSMWFLSLRNGGLIPSATGRAIFIGCMSAGGYSLSFSHYTRNHSLIASIAFSGATATILGIDCFAGAGWKEFWLYLWNLNDNVFPLNTNTYPVTKNIKAELAGVVIIAVFGVVSQMRVWKVVKEHRAKSATQKLEEQQDRDREEEALGHENEDKFQKERSQWEAAYGDKSIQDSSIRSSITSPKGSTSIQGTEVYGYDSLEMVNISKGGVMASTNPDTPAGTTVTVSVLRDEDIQHIDAQGNPINHKQFNPVVGSDRNDTLSNAQGTAPSDVTRPVVTNRSSLRPSAPPPPPAIVPLPFTVPQEADAQSEEEDNASVSALAETEHEADCTRRPISKRVSDMSAMRRHSRRDISESQEDLINIPYVEDDRASSVAATLDDDDDNISLHHLSPPRSPIGTEHATLIGTSTAREHSDGVASTKASKSDNVEARTLSENGEESTSQPANSQPLGPLKSNVNVEQSNPTNKDTSDLSPPQPAIRQSLTSSTDPKPDEPQEKRSSLRDSRIRAETLDSSTNRSSEGPQLKSTRLDASSAGSQMEHAKPQVGTLKDRVLPERLSKVALSYRTNEWAKHLEAAEKPDLDDLLVPASPGVILEEGFEETPAPVSDEIASPLMGSKKASKRTSLESRVHRSGGLNLQRSTSTFSQGSLVDERSMTRSPPVVSPGVVSRSSSGTRLDALSPLPSNTLMGQREKLMKNRISSQSLTPHTSSGNLLADQGEQENMTLAKRRQLLQHQTPSPILQHQASMTSQRKTPPSASQKWAKKGWAVQGAAAGFDSHQPKRASSSQSEQKREQLYAGWRDTMRDGTPQTAAYIAEQQRVALMNERRQREMDKQQREKIQQQRASQIDSMMRSGHMMDAHREAMRKMQANANKRA